MAGYSGGSYQGYPQGTLPPLPPAYQQMAQQPYAQAQQGVAAAQQQYGGAQQYAQQQGQYAGMHAQQAAMQAQQAGMQAQQAAAQYGAQPGYGAQMPAQYAAAGSYAGMQMAQMQQPYGQQQAPYVAAPKQQQVMPNPGPATQQRPAGPQAWSTSMWACCDDWFICCITNGSPSIMYGENYRKLHGSGFCSACCLYYWCSCFACCFANTTRANIRAKYNLPEEPCGDCCVHYFCSPCALCQEARELRKREGWQTWVD